MVMVVSLAMIALALSFACTSRQSPPEHSTEPSIEQARTSQPTWPPAAPGDVIAVKAPPSPEGSGLTVWAEGFRGQLIAGFDGAMYEPYRPSAIIRVQRALSRRGLYNGPINGILDTPTLKAIFAFQEANHSLQVCGVPTPRTRWVLERGSHTDPGP
jgi:hypothetical protein